MKKQAHHRPNHSHPVILFLLRASHFFHWSFHVLLPDFIAKVPSAKLNRFLFLKTRYFFKLRILAIAWLIVSIGILSITGYQFAQAPLIKAANTTFPFDIAGNYTFDSDRISIGSSLATLQAIDQTDDDNSTTGFGGGTFTDTEFSGGFLQLDATGLTNTTGSFTSRIIDAGGDVAWSDINWQPERPYNKDLPDSGSAESAYTQGNIDMSGNLVLIHGDETGVATTITDSSGNGNDYSCTTCPTTGAEGRFATSLDFNGGELLEDSDGETYLNGLSAFTLSAWVKSDVIGTDRGFFIGNSPSGSDDGLTIRYDDAGVNGGGNDVIKAGISTTAGQTQIESSSNIQTTDWQHIVLTWSAGNALDLYINGQLDTPTDAGAALGGTITGLDTAILGRGGKDEVAGSGWLGLIDEFAIFNRVLTPVEITNHYLRGASRLQIQVRSCDDAVCDTEQFIGPDGTSATFYSEEQNTTNGLPPNTALSSVSNNRYFQYQAILDAEDTVTSPEISTFSVLPPHVDAGGPTIENASGITYQTIDGFIETVGGGHTGSMQYQVSNNGTNFFYFNGLNWVPALNASQSNPANIINANASSIATDIGTGDFFFRAFLNSSLGVQVVELDEIEVIFDTGSSDDGDGGSSLLFFTQPLPPANGFSVTINEEATVTESRIVSLSFNAGSDVSLVELSNEPDFIQSITLTYQSPLSWDLCSAQGQPTEPCLEQDYTVYARFLKSFGQTPSPIVQDSITLIFADTEQEEPADQPGEQENDQETPQPAPDSEQNETNTEEQIPPSIEQEDLILPPPPSEEIEEPSSEPELLEPESTEVIPEQEPPPPTQPPQEQTVSSPQPTQQETTPPTIVETTQTVAQVSQEIGTENFLIKSTAPKQVSENDSFVVTFTSGSLAGQSILIEQFVANENELLFFTDLPSPPNTGDKFQVFSGTIFSPDRFVSSDTNTIASPVIIQYESFTNQKSFFWFLLGLLLVTITGFGLLVLVLFRLWKQNTALTTIIKAEHRELFKTKRKKRSSYEK